jgi:heterodisulfide reductase subunit D
MKMQEHIRERKKFFDDKCTRCGVCFTACPIVPFTPLTGADCQTMTRGLMELLAGRYASPEAVAWTASCTLCGACVEQCPERLNPRELFYLAKSIVGVEGASAQGFFTEMSRGIQLLARLQMPDSDFRRLTSPLGWGTAGADVLFYYGCNVLRTPDILLTAIEVLQRLGVSFGVLGGVANCCGIVHYRLGEVERGERIEQQTYERWLSFSPKRVLLWCPNCEMHFLQSALRNRRQPPFVIEHYAKFLADNVDKLKPLYRREVRRRAVLHEHDGHDLERQVKTILLSVPGLELVEVPQLRGYGYDCGIGSLSMAPRPVQSAVHRRLFEAAEAAKIDLVVTSNHACQMSLVTQEAQQPFQIKNFLGVVGEAMGIEREDLLKRYLHCADAGKIVEAATKFVRDNHLDTGRVKHDVARALAWGR